MAASATRCVAVVLALSMAGADPALGQDVAASASAEKPGSLYVQCDGQPDNMTGAETAARALGAIAVIGLLAPRPEQADASKRKFGADGVAACSALIDGDRKEGNARRRVHLMLSRALHRIEMKDYAAAIADAEMARREIAGSELGADPYYMRSQGRAPALIQAATLYRQGKDVEARDGALRSAAAGRRNFLTLASVPGYLLAVRASSDLERQYLGWRTHAAMLTASAEASRLEELGRFGDAARLRDALVDLDRADVPAVNNSVWLAQSAVSHALAGDAAAAADRARAAQENVARRKADGKPESNAAEFVELMDLYGIIRTANAGDLKAARRLFSARSQWVAASFGSVTAVAGRLRATAAADELIVGLSHTVDQMWTDRETTIRTAALARDGDNRTLFALIPAVVTAKEYEALSKSVWRTTKSSLLIVPKKPRADGGKLETMVLAEASPGVALEALMLHAALLARSRGQGGFVMTPVTAKGAAVITGNRGDPGLPEVLFNDADAVIAELSPVLPDPDALKARHAAAGS